MQFDLPLDELERYRPVVAEPNDFDEFWSRQLREVRSRPLAATFVPVTSLLETVEVLDVSFAGHGGDRICGWLILPRHRVEPLPTIVEYIGYGGGRGLPHESLVWSAAGYAHLIMDTRGQGSSWSTGASPDPGDSGDPSVPGYLTKGIQNPDSHYYVRLYIDAVQAVEAARSHPAVDGDRIAVTGASQGGGLAIVAAHLASGAQTTMSDVPFLAHFERALQVTDATPYAELAEYCRTHRDQIARAFATLSYVDVVNHAKRCHIPALFSVGLADVVTPPSTVFAAFNWYGGTKSIRVYPYNGHEGGGAHHFQEKLQFAKDHLGAPAA
jgi:cephalosporin-C deacetylase